MITAGNADGSWQTQSIETIVVGDYVLSRPDDDPSAPLERRRVTAVFRHTEFSVRVVEFENPATGDVETIRCTASHPFWVENLGWVAAGELVVGQRVLNGDGTWSVVRGVGEEAHPEGLTVYNLEVEGGHTYFVEDGQGLQSPLWVHNRCWGDRVREAYGKIPQWIIDQGLRAHGHHIVFKGEYLFWPKMRKVLKESRAILKRAGITDYVNDIRNLTWAPNRGHTVEQAIRVRDALKAAEEVGGSKEVVKRLMEIGKEIRDGAWII